LPDEGVLPVKEYVWMHVDISEVIGRIEAWRGKKVTCNPLGGGITNHNYTVQVGDDTFVVRIPGEGTDIFIDRDNELQCSRAAGEAGVAPRVLYHLKPENITVVPFIRGRTLTTQEIVRDNELIQRVVHAIKTVHDKVSFTNIFNPFETVRRYMGYVERYDAPLPDDFPWMEERVRCIEEVLNRNPLEMVACHNDYLSENFLDDGKKIWIIDWEYGGLCDPFFDLGDFGVEHPFTREQEELIIREYCGGMDHAKMSRMLLYKIISDYWWSVWAMIQSRISKIKFDFYVYGNRRFDRMRQNMEDPDFNKWLKKV
jgi:thiamine kinase-like enzyme